MDLVTILSSVFILLYFVLVIRTMLKIILQNRNPLKTYAYILLLILLPGVGLLVYLFLGKQYKRRKVFNQRRLINDKLLKSSRERYLQLFTRNYDIVEKHLENRVKIPKLLNNEDQTVLTLYNDVDVLRNGEEKFPALFKDLKEAKNHIHIEYYIFIDDKIGNHLIDILCSKAEEGVDVKLIFDSVGSSSLSKEAILKMKWSNIKIGEYLPTRFAKFASVLNFRDHRKIVVIDGKIGYVGGINIEQKYDNRYEQENPYYWRDTSLRVTGDAVYELQTLFFMNWDFVSDEFLEPNETFFPKNEIKNECLCSVVGSGPESQPYILMYTIFNMITNAKNKIRIVSPYFIPNESILTALKTSVKSGVEVELIVPGISDSKLVKAATNSYIPDLIDSGIKVYFYEKGFVHSKVIIVDDDLSSVGTANMDFRSFEQNSEVNMIIYNKEVAKNLIDQFELDLKDSIELKRSYWNDLSPTDRVFASFARLFSPIL